MFTNLDKEIRFAYFGYFKVRTFCYFLVSKSKVKNNSLKVTRSNNENTQNNTKSERVYKTPKER